MSCWDCKHFDIKTHSCPAFDGFIPITIASGDVPHDKVLPKQKGTYVFTRDPRPMKERLKAAGYKI